MSREHHFYDKGTGLFTGRSIRTKDPRVVALNTPAGCGATAAVTDRQAQRVDVRTGKVVDYQPPAPDENHDWNGKRWIMRADVAQREARVRDATKRIEAAEARQGRAVREVLLRILDLLEAAQKSPGASRLKSIDAEIADLRLIINS